MYNVLSNILIAILLARFLVAGQPKNIKYRYQGITKLGLSGKPLTIECPLTGPFYFWRFYQPNLESRVLLEQDSKNITMETATIDKTGIYECKSTTGFGNAITNISLKIIDPNSELSKEICSFTKTDNSQDFLGGLCFLNDNYQRKASFKMGSSTELDCDAVGRNLQYTWKFVDQNGIQVRIVKSSNITQLQITNIIPENEGTYKCEVMNDQALKLYRSFPITISDITSGSGIEIVGNRLVSNTMRYGDNISLICEIKNSYQRIHSIKWGKRISDPIAESRFKSNVVFWDHHKYRVLPISGILESNTNPNQITSTLYLTRVDETNSGIYICLVMNTFGGTAYKLFNVTVTTDAYVDNSGKRSQFFFLYILLPAILILICVCAIIYCCVKSSSAKSSNSVPLKQYNSSTPSNGNKTATSNYYYPVNNTRGSNNCPPLPQPAESQVSQISPSTLTSYSSYGNYQYLPSNQQSCYNSNGV